MQVSDDLFLVIFKQLAAPLCVTFPLTSNHSVQVFSSHITSSNLLPCSSDESQELSSKVEELAVEQEEENKALLELETRLVELVEAIRGLEEQVKNNDNLWSQMLVAELEAPVIVSF